MLHYNQMSFACCPHCSKPILASLQKFSVHVLECDELRLKDFVHVIEQLTSFEDLCEFYANTFNIKVDLLRTSSVAPQAPAAAPAAIANTPQPTSTRPMTRMASNANSSAVSPAAHTVTVQPLRTNWSTSVASPTVQSSHTVQSSQSLNQRNKRPGQEAPKNEFPMSLESTSQFAVENIDTLSHQRRAQNQRMFDECMAQAAHLLRGEAQDLVPSDLLRKARSAVCGISSSSESDDMTPKRPWHLYLQTVTQFGDHIRDKIITNQDIEAFEQRSIAAWDSFDELDDSTGPLHRQGKGANDDERPVVKRVKIPIPENAMKESLGETKEITSPTPTAWPNSKPSSNTSATVAAQVVTAVKAVQS